LYIAIGDHVARAAFKKFDKNNDSYLNIKEIMELVKILQSKSNGENKIQTKSSQNAMFDDSNNNLEDPDNLQEPNHNIQVEKMKNWEKVIQILKNSLS
jgi:Ca2+-binding EF-hand superfamily protein